MEKHVVVLGAGPAGMSAAFELARNGIKVTVVEKDSAVGGLARTLVFDEPDGTYRTDIGPHRFFSKNKYLYSMLEDLLDEHWIEVPRLTRFFVNGTFYYYPVKLSNVLTGMGPIGAFRILRDYLYERIRSKIAPRSINSFEDYVVVQFGRTLANFNMINYTEKIWGIPAGDISVDWASQRIKGLSLIALIRSMFSRKNNAKSLVDSFFYPNLGTGLIYDRMHQEIEKRGGTILLNSEPTKFTTEKNRMTSVTIQTQDGEQTIKADAVISSIPVQRGIMLFGDSAPQEVRDAASALQFRAQVYLFLTVDKDQIMPDNWVYFPDKDIPFGRIAEMKNFSKDMCPEGKTSLFIEYFCFENDEIWNMDKDTLFAKSMDWFEKLNMLDRKDVQSVHHLRRTNVYPIYDLQYKARIHSVMDFMDSFENYYAIGRPGRFRYTNQDHSIEMGILAARSVIEGKRREIEDVGMEKEYFEKGYVPKS